MLDDFDIDKEAADPTPPPVTRERQWLVPALIALAAVLAAGAAVWFLLMRPTPEQSAATPTPKPAAAAAAAPGAIQPLCAMSGANAAVPALNDSDPFAKKSASGLSAHPRVAAWLATNNVIRNFVVAVDNVASGATPAPRMRALRPAGAFRVREARGGTFIDPRSFERYGPIADAVESLNPQTAAQLCGTLKPRLVEAYAELGREGSFDVALERAIVELLRTPAIGPDTRVVPNGASYAFEDEALEQLTPAQKQLARMGPRNARIIQDKLRQLALAIGIPADRLPG
jgi:Protein of unknown function (DUF3014)